MANFGPEYTLRTSILPSIIVSMCSIAGLTPSDNLRGTIEDMIAVQTHRAPDESGFHKADEIHLAMGRLKIIDLASPGLAPYKEGEWVLCYNGEIYNYLELKEDLKKLGHEFSTTSDTEVLMKSWKEWGVKMFDKLNGMFACAIYNTQTKKLLLARDIVGEKPLYYFNRGKQLVFASEAKAIAKVVNVEHQDSPFYEGFQHCFVETLWKDVYEVPPAHYMTYDVETGNKEIVEYWKFEPRDIKLDTAQEELEALLIDSVKLRTRSDVPYGLYFSGGIDSSIISVLHNFDHQYYFDNTKEELKDLFFEEIPTVLKHLDFPVGSLGFYGMWNLARNATKDVTVILSGEGADELFGGYVRYMPIAREHQLRKHFPSYDYLFGKHFGVKDYVDAFARVTCRNPDYMEVVRERIQPYFEMFDDPIHAMGFADFKLILPSLMQMGDRMAAAFSIENRCPFLDRRIIEFGFSLPTEYKVNGLEQKVILRRIAEKHNLQDALNMEKKGMSVAYNKWQNKSGWDRSDYFNFLKQIWQEIYPESFKNSGIVTRTSSTS